jgi:hypothetical protein
MRPAVTLALAAAFLLPAVAATGPQTVESAFGRARTCLLAHGAAHVWRRPAGGQVQFRGAPLDGLTGKPTRHDWVYSTSSTDRSRVLYVANVLTFAYSLAFAQRRVFYRCTHVAGVPNRHTRVP